MQRWGSPGCGDGDEGPAEWGRHRNSRVLGGVWGARVWGGDGGPRCAAGRRGRPLAGAGGAGFGRAGAPHLPVAPLEDHGEGAVPDQVLARELELAHGLQAAAAGLHGAGGRSGGGAGRGRRAPGGAPHRAGRARLQPHGPLGALSQPGLLLRIPARLQLGLGSGLQLGLRRGNKRAAAAGPLSLRRRRRRSARREAGHGAGPGGAAALGGRGGGGRALVGAGRSQPWTRPLGRPGGRGGRGTVL